MDITERKQYEQSLSLTISRAIFSLFWGCQRPDFDNKITDHLDTSNGSDPLSTNASSPSRDRDSLRADLGQSQSGSSSLSPRAYRGEPTTAELAVSEILPITSVRAPRYCGRRSLTGAKG
jgi:hypothetical protein